MSFAAFVGGAGCIRRLDQGLGFQPAVISIRGITLFGYRISNKLEVQSVKIGFY